MRAMPLTTPAHPEAAEGAEQRQRQREHDHERMPQALELRRQDHVDDQDRQEQHPRGFGGAFLDLVGFPRPSGR